MRTVGGGAVVAGASMIAGCGAGGDGEDGDGQPGDGGDGTDGDGGGDGTGGDGDGDGDGGDGEIQRGGILRTAMPGDAQEGGGLLPMAYRTRPAWEVSFSFGDRLLFMDPNTAEIQPWLATDWEWFDDGMGITFTIREGVEFHPPYDREMVPQDIVECFALLLDPEFGSPVHGDFSSMVAEDVPPEDLLYTEDGNRVTFEFLEPFPNILQQVGGQDRLTIFPPESYEEHGDDLGSIDIGGAWTTGPFMFDEAQADSYYQLERNPNYWLEDENGEQLPYLDGVRWEVMPEATPRRAGLIAGDLDVIGQIPGAHYQALSDANNVTVDTAASTRLDKILPNYWHWEPARDRHFTRALNYAVNKEACNATAYSNLGTPAYTYIPPDFDTELLSFPELEDELEDYQIGEVAVEEAQNEMEQSDHQNLMDEGFLMLTTPGENLVQQATVAQQNFTEAGFDNVEVEPRPRASGWGQWVGQWQNNGPPEDQQIMVQNISRKSYHPNDYVCYTHEQGSYGNLNYQNIDRTNELCQQGLSQTDPAEAKETYSDLLRHLHDNVPTPPLVFQPIINAWRNAVKGYGGADPFDKRYYHWTWLDE